MNNEPFATVFDYLLVIACVAVVVVTLLSAGGCQAVRIITQDCVPAVMVEMGVITIEQCKGRPDVKTTN